MSQTQRTRRQAPRPGKRATPTTGRKTSHRPAKRGCIGGLLMDITGISFLAGMKKRLGGPGFALAFLGVLFFMFVLGARIERYGHLGEHHYVMQILPAASMFSPILGLLMTLAFAVGDCLTNATYWLFPQSSPLNMYTLFGKPHPLLTWGAYARMDFFTLPLYALLPGLGARIFYTVASRLFHAGRAKIMKDGGKNDGSLEEQLQDALKDQKKLVGQEQQLLKEVEKVDGEVKSVQEEWSESAGREGRAADSIRSANDTTRTANERAQLEQKAAAEVSSEAQKAKAMSEQALQAQQIAEKAEAQAAGTVDQSQGRRDDLQAQQDRLDSSLDKNKAEFEKLNEEIIDSKIKKVEIQKMLDSGKDEAGNPLTPERASELKTGLSRCNEELDGLQEHQAKVLSEQKELQKAVEDNGKALEEEQKRLDGLKEDYREKKLEAEKRAREADSNRQRQEELEAEARKHQAAERAARDEAERSAREAREQEQSLKEARRVRQEKERELAKLAEERNRLADKVNDLHAHRLEVDDQVQDLQQQIEGPKAGVPPGRTRRHHHRDAMEDAIRRYDAAMYEAMARQRRERDMLIRSLQQQNRGLFPSGMAGGQVAGMGAITGQGFASIGAAIVGAAAGGALGGGLLHGHMWAEYNPIRELVHPSHTADIGCYKMDVGYLDKNIMSGVGTSMSLGPAVGIVGATPGVPPPTGPGVPHAAAPQPGGGGGEWAAPPGASGGEGGQPSSEEREACQEAAGAREEAEKYKRQFADSESTADKTDPNYQKVKKQYEDYIKYQEERAAEAEAKADELKGERESREAEARDSAERKNEWIRNRQEDVKALEEEKAHLLGVMAGIQRAGMDGSAHKGRLDQINKRLGDLHTQLGKEGGDISYQARDRGVIGVGKEFGEADAQMHQKQALLDKLQKMQKTAFKDGMLEPGAKGKGRDIYGKLGNIINDLTSGKKVDPDKIRLIREHMGHRIDGTVGDPSRPPAPEKPWYTDGESWSKAFSESARNVSTCRTSDGNISWSGLAGRIGIGILTMGSSEWVFVPAGALHVTKDAVDRGADGIEAWREGMSETIKQELIGKAFGGVFHVLGGAGKGVLAAGKAGEGIIGGGLKGGWKGLKTFGSEMAKEGSEFLSKEGWKRAGQGLFQSMSGGASRLKALVSGEEGFELGLGKGTQEGAEAAAKSPPMGTPEWAKQQQVRRAIATGDPDVVAGLYRDGGMSDLVQLQQNGFISATEARGLNQLVQTEVNASIQRGTTSSITDFQNRTGVRMKELVVGDSGSSARGAPIRLKTDADRTLVPTFDEADLNRYAHNNNMSRNQAYDELCQKFQETHQASVASELRSRGFGNTGDPNLQSPMDNVGYASYDRIGAGSGQCDSYAEGFTNARQAGQGTGQVYRVNPDGTVNDPYRVSGHTVVDQNRLNRARFGGDAVPEDATQIPPREIPSVLDQQTGAIGRHPDDPLTVAKAVGRTEKVANTVGESLRDPRLTQAAKEIYEDPSKMNEVLKQYGYVDAHGNPDPSVFCREGGGAVGTYRDSFNSIRPGGQPPTR